VPVHHRRAEQARRGNRGRDLESPAVGGGHCDRLGLVLRPCLRS
jgi:hypothetical protein